MSNRWIPPELRIAPRLDWTVPPQPVTPKFALLINPFYPKDPHASFGKHVLTPTLALTSVAAATPADWRVKYWDENLLKGPPPFRPFPSVVGISVHLTFAKRAYELARWFRQRGAKVVFGGLHVLSCPDECAEHADAIAVGDGVQLWYDILRDAERGQLKPRYAADYKRPYRLDPRRGAICFRAATFLRRQASSRRAGATIAAGFAICRPTGCTCRISPVMSSKSSMNSRPTISHTLCSSTIILDQSRSIFAAFVQPCGH